ncbi:hypothetical protein DAMA08_001060 [Martiniozyma asiatica (nom. inval.)]|nr:hypothetical protein DAMA08_001060 [Martiniozyma asiatica]
MTDTEQSFCNPFRGECTFKKYGDDLNPTIEYPVIFDSLEHTRVPTTDDDLFDVLDEKSFYSCENQTENSFSYMEQSHPDFYFPNSYANESTPLKNLSCNLDSHYTDLTYNPLPRLHSKYKIYNKNQLFKSKIDKRQSENKISSAGFNASTNLKRLKNFSNSITDKQNDSFKGRPCTNNINCYLTFYKDFSSLFHSISKKKSNLKFYQFEFKTDNSIILKLENLLQTLKSNSDSQSLVLNAEPQKYYEFFEKFTENNDDFKILTENVTKGIKKKFVELSSNNIHATIAQLFSISGEYTFIRTIHDHKGRVLKTETVNPPIYENEIFYTVKWIKENICYPRYKKNMNINILQGRYDFLIYNDISMLLWDINESKKLCHDIMLESKFFYKTIYVKKQNS